MYKTKNLGLNITEMPKDKLDTFSFHTDLGYNFESIDNLALSHRNITNCILEIPQNIKLDLVNGDIILREGSTIYIPNGVGNFSGYGISYDIYNSLFDKTGTKQVMLFFNPGTERLDSYIVGTNIYSGATAPTSTSLYGVWYDTANNSIKTTDDNGSNWQDLSFSLPVAIVTITNGVATSIDQVFNGFGYIGSTVFALPGVKCLIPNGRNADGSLKNIIVSSKVSIFDNFINAHTVNSIILLEDGTIMQSTYLGSYEEAPEPFGAWGFYYNLAEQVFYHNNDGTWLKRPACYAGYLTNISGRISSFIPKKPFQAVDYNDYSTKIAELETKIQTLQAAVEALQG